MCHFVTPKRNLSATDLASYPPVMHHRVLFHTRDKESPPCKPYYLFR